MQTALKLKIEGVRKRYGKVDALRETSLAVHQGEFLTLLGPSGSGKTTLLMAVAGLVMPDAGKIWIDGRDATRSPVHRRDIGMMFQNYALFPHLSVADNIAFPLVMRGVDKSEIARRVQKMLDIVCLPQLASRLPKELSGGQQQRVALARCAVYGPSIILMDEPLGALDKKLRDQMQLEIKRLHVELGATILYVTHDQDEAMTLSDRICLMNDGAVAQLGSPEDLYFRPASVFAADFLGGANFLRATVTAVEVGGVCLQTQHPQQAQTLVAAHAAGAATQWTVGQTVQILVRPEHITLLDDDKTPGQSADNVVQGRLVRSIMAGAMRRHFVEIAGGAELAVLALTAAPGAGFGAGFKPGSAVRLGWSREHTVLLADGGQP